MNPPSAIVISIGDELVLGQTVDTNSAWISQQLAAIGVPVAAHITVADDQAAIEQAIRDAAPRCRWLIVSGGLGPTEDDLTRQALAAVMGAPLELNQQWMEALHEFFAKRGRPMPDRNRIQAMIPRGADMIHNHNGTAAGIHAQLATSNLQLATDVFVVPGVPKEMKLMLQRDVLPHIAAAGGGGVILSRTLHTFGLGESWVAEKLGDLMARGRNPSVGTTVSGGIVSLRLNARYPSADEARRQLDATEALCRQALGDLIFGVDDDTLPAAVARLLKDHPDAQRWAPAVCTAESCTGGLVAKYLTDVPGSSAYFRQGWITYDNKAKVNELGVSQATLTQHGAVSRQTVTEMARGAATRSGAPYALAISGIAGPDGGTPHKPVGTVCIALSYPSPADPAEMGVLARTFNFPGDREMIRDRAAKMALAMLRFHLLGKPLPF